MNSYCKQILQIYSLIEKYYRKLDKILDENKQSMVKADHFLNELAQINPKTIETVQTNIQILSQENLTLQSKLNQLRKQINSITLNSLLVKKVEIDKKIPKFHSDAINKIISYKNKFITCSRDKTIIIRKCKDNKVIRTLTDHEAPVRDIILLSD